MNSTDSQIWARDALSLPLPLTGDQLPTDIQWMPPGEHQITALKEGEPITLTVSVHAGTAERMNRLLQELRSKAAAGLEDYPYFDFNHEDGEASGRPLEFYWGGDDLKSGGVRVKAEWSDRTKQSLAGKVPGFRRFSPSFSVNADGEVTGAPLNMGGLVNRAAFKTIQPIVAAGPPKGGTPNGDQRKANMDAEKLAADLAAAQTTIAELTRKLAAADQKTTIAAKDGEIETLKATIKTLEGKVATGAKESAKAIVDAAVKAGKLAPQATALHEKWINAIAVDPALAETLTAMPANPALGTVIHDGSTGAPASGTAQSQEHQFVVKSKAFAAQQKISFADATMQIAGTEPALYEDYRRSLAVAAKS
jgi:hypothetical protein